MTREPRWLSIGEVAAETGLRPSTLRYYEDEGLIRPTARVGGRRHYDPSVVSRLAIIALCQEVGFSVAELHSVLGVRRGARTRWQKIAERKLEELDRHIERAEATRRLLRAAIDCGCGDPGSCHLVTDAAARRRDDALSRDGAPRSRRARSASGRRPG